MAGYIINIEEETLAGSDFRRVLYTAPHSQLVLMTLQPGEDIGEEVHQHVDQFFRIESGRGRVVLNDEVTEVGDGFAIVVPAGTKHNLINIGDTPLKLYTIYSPANHPDGTIHHTKAEADEYEKHHHHQN